MDFWYNSQIRQYRLQFVRAFSNFYVMTGANTANPQLRKVPCRYGESSRIAATIVKGNSENTTMTCPFITCHITGFSMNGQRRQDPTYIEKTQVNERYFDPDTQKYTGKIGNRYTIEKYMPVPYDLTFELNIWTDNIDIKEQLLEQILVLYNPQIDFQTSNNPMDWTMLSTIELLDNITWTSLSIPQGTSNDIDVTTMTFKVPIWLNAPAKVKTQKIIQEIVTNIIEGYKDPGDFEWSEYEFLQQTVITPGDFDISISYQSANTYIVELLQNQSAEDTSGEPTLTFTKDNPILIANTQFQFNGILLTVSSTDIDSAILSFNNSLSNTQFSCQRYGNQIQFINNSGQDNIFIDGSGSPLNGFGLMTGIYPGKTFNWWRLFQQYGTVKPYSKFLSDASKITLVNDISQGPTSNDIRGWIDFHPTDQNKLIWHIDITSLPTPDINAITAIIDPTKVAPGVGLPTSGIGQRYLLLSPNPLNTSNWGSLTALENDIVEFDGTNWNISFDTSFITGIHYVLNNFNGSLLEYNDGWSSYIPKTSEPGHWKIQL